MTNSLSQGSFLYEKSLFETAVPGGERPFLLSDEKSRLLAYT
ncbi:MAG: hypothetical protein R3D55_20440 [Chloroflexota bacterium]